MKKYNMITPEGTKDVLFEECFQKRHIQKVLADIFSKRGYNEVITPGLEYYDVFDLEGASIPQHEMYKSTDNKGRLIVFRPDLTLPIARLTATRLQGMELPIRLYYNQSVYRNRPDLTGRSDESTQAGIELMGGKGLRADLEVVCTAIESLSQLFSDYRIEIGHAGIFRILSEGLNVSEEVREDIRGIIESKNYGALSDVLAKLPASKYRDAIGRLPRLFGGSEVFAEAKKLCDDQKLRDLLEYLETLYHSLCSLGLGDKIMVDLGLVQRNDYYTGVVFSAYAQGHGDAVVMGGRYDSLLEKFNCPMEAVGFAVDVDAVTKLLLKEADSCPVPDVFLHGDCGYEIQVQVKLHELVQSGMICENSLKCTREEAMLYAKNKGIKRIIFLGKDGEEEVLL